MKLATRFTLKHSDMFFIDMTQLRRYTRLAKELENAELKHQLAIQRHEDEVADLCLGSRFAEILWRVYGFLIDQFFFMFRSESIARKFQHDVLLKSLSA